MKFQNWFSARKMRIVIFFKKSDFISSVLWPKKIHHQIIRIEFCAQANEKVKKRALYCHAYVLLQCIRDGVFVQNVKNVHFSNIWCIVFSRVMISIEGSTMFFFRCLHAFTFNSRSACGLYTISYKLVFLRLLFRIFPIPSKTIHRWMYCESKMSQFDLKPLLKSDLHGRNNKC